MIKKFVLSLLFIGIVFMIVFLTASIQSKPESYQKDKVAQVKNEITFGTIADVTLLVLVTLIYVRK